MVISTQTYKDSERVGQRKSSLFSNVGLGLLVAFAWGSQRWPEYSATLAIAALAVALVAGLLSFWLYTPERLKGLLGRHASIFASNRTRSPKRPESLAVPHADRHQQAFFWSKLSGELGGTLSSKHITRAYPVPWLKQEKHTYLEVEPTGTSCTVQVGLVTIQISGDHADIKVNAATSRIISPKPFKSDDKVDVVLVGEGGLVGDEGVMRVQ